MIKKKLPIAFFFLLVSLVIFCIITSGKAFYLEIVNTLTIWLYNVYPSIFTLYLIASTLISFNIVNRLTFLFKPIIKFSSDKAYELYIISILIGNPSSASLIIDELNAENITEGDAKKLINICAFFNPLFIISIITFTSLKNIKYTLLIIIAMMMTSILTSLFYQNKNESFSKHHEPINIQLEKVFKAIESVMYLLIIVAGIMVFSNIIKFSLETLFHYLNLKGFGTHFLLANLEVATGVFEIAKLNFKVPYFLSLICFMLTFQGLSINLQVATVIKDLQINFHSLLLIRIIQAFIASIICFTICVIFF